MARMRTVKPEFFRSATIGKLDRDARLLFIGMWTEADDHGRGLAEPRHLAGSLFPFDRDVNERKISKWLRELVDVVCSDGERGLVRLYDANGSTYYAIRNWWHQKVNRPGAPRYPGPPSESLFDPPPPNGTPGNGTPDSLNGTNTRDENAGLDSVNGARQGSGVRGQKSGNRGQGSGARKQDSVNGGAQAPGPEPSPDGEDEDKTPGHGRAEWEETRAKLAAVRSMPA